MIRFGEMVRDMREARGVSLRQFARRLDISPAYLSRVERCDVPPPSEKRIEVIAAQLGIDTDYAMALAGKVRSDLLQIIIANPVEMAALLREEAGQQRRVEDWKREHQIHDYLMGRARWPDGRP